MRRATLTITTIVAMLAVLVIAGCGGGGGEAPAGGDDPGDKSTLGGTVYTSGPIPAQAGQAPGAQVLYDATIVARRMDNNAYLADTMTSSTGRYNFPDLARGLDILLTCNSRGQEVLMARAYLTARNVTVDVDEDTTLVTRCQLLMRANGGGQTSADVEDTVAQLCTQFQQQNRFQYGDLGGARPDFTNVDAQWRAAAALLAAAADEAVTQARNSGAAGLCERAVDMVCARLQAEGIIDFNPDAATRAQIANALQSGAVFSEAQITQALSAAINKTVTPEAVCPVRARLSWDCVQGRTGPLDIVEATATMCAGGDQNRLQSATHVADFVAALID